MPDTAKTAAETASQTLKITQRAYVTIGRADGIAAEFLMPKEPKGNVGVVIYFQNSGHLPDKFNWGILTGLGLESKSSPKFTPMTRTKNRKDGSMGESGGITIASGSVHVGDFGEISQEDANRLAHSNQLALIWGAYEYCDDLGTYACRQFHIYYKGFPYNTFSSRHRYRVSVLHA